MDQRLAMVICALIDRMRDLPDEAINELLRALDAIERKYGMEYALDDADRRAIEEVLADPNKRAWAPQEEVDALFRDALAGYDEEADGKETLGEAVERLRKQPGTIQGSVADVIFTILNEHRFDLPAPPKNARR